MSFMLARWDGLAFLIGLVAEHLAIVFCMSLYFVTHTRYSLLGNYWQVVSYVVGEDTTPVLERAGEMTDKEVKKWLKENAKGGQRAHVKLRRRHDRQTKGNLEIIQYQGSKWVV